MPKLIWVKAKSVMHDDSTERGEAEEEKVGLSKVLMNVLGLFNYYV